MTPERVILTFVESGVRNIERVRDLSGLHSATFGVALAQLLDDGGLILLENEVELSSSKKEKFVRLGCLVRADGSVTVFVKIDDLPNWNKDEVRVGSDQEIFSRIIDEYLEGREKNEICD